MKKECGLYNVALKLFLKNNNGEILGLKKTGNGPFSGSYDVPGGRIDTDEFKKSFAEIINREVEEELGDISYKLNPRPVALGRHFVPGKFVRDRKDVKIFYIFFEADYKGGEIKISQEHEYYKWLNLRESPPDTLFTSGILDGIKQYLTEEKSPAF